MMSNVVQSLNDLQCLNDAPKREGAGLDLFSVQQLVRQAMPPARNWVGRGGGGQFRDSPNATRLYLACALGAFFFFFFFFGGGRLVGKESRDGCEQSSPV